VRLVVQRLSRSYGPRRIFGPLSFAVEAGEVLGVAGSNGSGKTTLLRTLAGLIRPTSGSVTFEGITPAGGVPPREAFHAIGWAAPDLALYGELTPAENLAFFAEVSGHDPSPAAVEGHLTRVGLDPERGRTVATRSLSTGQRQRLKLAFATLKRPAVLYLDEPGSNLDEAGHQVVARVVAEQRGHGLAIVASNDPRDLSLADRTISL
jgi:heme exporter protein A